MKLVEFVNGEGDEADRFVAYGRDELQMPVYTVGEGVHYETVSMNFPSCLKFMPDADVGEMRDVSAAFIRRRYGEMVPNPMRDNGQET